MCKPRPMFFALASQCLAAAINQSSCSSQAISVPSIPSIEVTQLLADPVSGYVVQTPSSNVTVSFCNTTLTYTHPSWNDSVNVFIWLPSSNWNERLQGIGGGVFAGLQPFTGHEQAIANNYSAVGTNTGHFMNAFDASSWALDASGKVNLGLLENFAAVAQNDAALIAKSLVESYYGQAPKRSYWNGCSIGGRQ